MFGGDILLDLDGECVEAAEVQRQGRGGGEAQQQQDGGRGRGGHHDHGVDSAGVELGLHVEAVCVQATLLTLLRPPRN